MSAGLSVVIPAYNEQATITKVVREVLQVPHLHEIVIVDDCSSDGTFELASQLAAAHPEIKVLRHAANSGKTAALSGDLAAEKGRACTHKCSIGHFVPFLAGKWLRLSLPRIGGHLW